MTQGVIRKVTEITDELLWHGIFQVYGVRPLCLQLAPMVGHGNNRPLVDSRFPFILVGAMVVKIREENSRTPNEQKKAAPQNIFVP
ncbi:transposase [Paenibacillus pabuli]